MISAEKHSLNITVCGAGIAGLCAGIGLAQQGHDVTILESAHELHAVGIGIHLPPNATLVLKHLGLMDRLSPEAMYPSTFTLRRWADSGIIASTAETENKSTGGSAPYWTMRRADYQRHLADAAREAGCTLRLGAKVTSLDVDLPSVTLEGGETISTDLVVVADGIKSKLRELLIPEENVSVIAGNLSCYRAYVSHEDLMSDPATAAAFNHTPSNVWAGCNRHMIVYPCGGGLYTIGAVYPAEATEAMAWNQSATSEEAQKEFRCWQNPAVDHVLSHAQNIKNWRLAEVPRLPRWTSKSGKAVLIGDAAHAMYQFLAQGAAMATEDAAALTECVGRAKNAEDLPAVLRAFERSRKWRCEIIAAESKRSGEVLHVADGEEQENRDKKMAGKPHNDSFWDVDVGPLMEQKFPAFLYGHDVVDHTRKTLASMSL